MLNICYSMLNNMVRSTTPEEERYFFRLYKMGSNSQGCFIDPSVGKIYQFTDEAWVSSPITNLDKYYYNRNYYTEFYLDHSNSLILPNSSTSNLKRYNSIDSFDWLKVDLDWSVYNHNGPFNSGGVYFSHVYSWAFSASYYGVLTVENREQYDYFVKEISRFPDWRDKLKPHFKMLSSYETCVGRTIPLLCIIMVDFTGYWCYHDVIFGFSNNGFPSDIKPVTFGFVRFKKEIYTDRNKGNSIGKGDGTKDVLGRTGVTLWPTLYAALCIS